MKVLNDPQSLLLFQQGDQAIFDKVFEEEKENVYRVAYKILKHTAEAEDIVSIVFETLWNDKARIKGAAHGENYLRVIARNKSIDAARKKKKSNTTLTGDEDIPEPLSLDDEDALGRERIEELVVRHAKKALLEEDSDLPPRMQEVARLKILTGLKFREIAQRLGVDESTVRSQWSQASRRLMEGARKLFIL